MKIVLVEKGTGDSGSSERTFEQATVRIGRDSANCDIVYDSDNYRMVSRHHAELRWQNSSWILSDNNSSFGTFVNGSRLSQPTPVVIGSSIQFGANGPIVHVIWMEGTVANQNDQHANSSPPLDPMSPPRAPHAKPAVAAPPKPKVRDSARLELVGTHCGSPVEITKDSFWLGRDPKGDIVIEGSAVMVSRAHAEIRYQNNDYVAVDNNSFNGTLVNERRISSETPLYDNDRIQLGRGGPVLKFISPNRIAPKENIDIAMGNPAPGLPAQANVGSATMVFNLGDVSQPVPGGKTGEQQLLLQLGFDGKNELQIGRNESNDISLDGLQISNLHARLKNTGGAIVIEDLNSTNGVYVNGERISRQSVSPSDLIQIGSFVIKIDEQGTIGVFDTRSKIRIDSIGITKEVKNRAGGGKIKLLDDISLSIKPNEFIGLLGPSGAGKSTYMDALNGMRPPTHGSVLVNNQDLYRYLDSLKQSIGYVPQDDIIHRELTVYKTLFYVAKLRLSRDVSRSEIDQIIEEVLDVTGLDERRDVLISELSGGQRKRVSIAVELITKPSIIYLDEPTSGLDPATEEKIMKLFRQIAESGRTVILTTHAMENVRLFDKIVVLMRGKLVFYGKPEEALVHLGASSFKDLYDKLEVPINEKILEYGESDRFSITEEVAEEWKAKFLKTVQYKKNVFEPLREVQKSDSSKSRKGHRLGIFGSIRQAITLSRRYARVLSKDKMNLFILFAQAPIIAILVFFVMGEDQPRDFAYFALSLCSIWFGTSVASREIVRERPVYGRERMVNLGIFPYLSSKLFILGSIVAIQCVMLFVPLKFFDLTGLMPMPGLFLGIPQFFTMLVTASVGVALGLFISALVKTSEMATSLIPLILIPQIIFSGLIGVPTGINKVVGLAMPATWSFDTMKRFSPLDTLEADGSLPDGKTKGLGLYKYIETENDEIIEEAQKNIKDYEKDLEAKLQAAEKRANEGEKVEFSGMPDRPKVADAEKIPENLSSYINFRHPWMHEFLNLLVLMIMFSGLLLLTLIILRLQDIG